MYSDKVKNFDVFAKISGLMVFNHNIFQINKIHALDIRFCCRVDQLIMDHFLHYGQSCLVDYLPM